MKIKIKLGTVNNAALFTAKCNEYIEDIDFIYVDTSTSLNATDVFNNKAPADNLTNVNNTIVKFEGEMNEIYLTNFNENAAYRFGVGSRFAVYGR